MQDYRYENQQAKNWYKIPLGANNHARTKIKKEAGFI